MRTLFLAVLIGAASLALLLIGWSLEDAGVHLPGEGTPAAPICSPTAAAPR